MLELQNGLWGCDIFHSIITVAVSSAGRKVTEKGQVASSEVADTSSAALQVVLMIMWRVFFLG